MNAKRYRVLQQIACKCINTMWDNIDDHLTNEELEYIFLYLIKELNGDLLRWKYEA